MADVQGLASVPTTCIALPYSNAWPLAMVLGMPTSPRIPVDTAIPGKMRRSPIWPQSWDRHVSEHGTKIRSCYSFARLSCTGSQSDGLELVVHLGPKGEIPIEWEGILVDESGYGLCRSGCTRPRHFTYNAVNTRSTGLGSVEKEWRQTDALARRTRFLKCPAKGPAFSPVQRSRAQ